MKRNILIAHLAPVFFNFFIISDAHAQEVNREEKVEKIFEFKGQNTKREFPSPEEIKKLCNRTSGKNIIKTGSGKCRNNDPFAGVTRVLIDYEFLNKKFVSVKGEFYSEDFEKIMNAFTVKYGQPSFQRNFELQNRFGAKFMNTGMMWKFSDGTLILDRYSSTIDVGGFLFKVNDPSKQTSDEPQIDF